MGDAADMALDDEFEEGIGRVKVEERLRKRIVSHCLRFGDFTLASGQKSSYYLDLKALLFHGRWLLDLGKVLYYELESLAGSFNSVGGPELGAVPIATALLAVLNGPGWLRSGRQYTCAPVFPLCHQFVVRKEAKGHGTNKLVDGYCEAGDRVVVVEDVLTTGQSTLRAIKAVEDLGATVVCVVGVVDREQGAKDALKAYDYRPLFTVSDLGVKVAEGEVTGPCKDCGGIGTRRGSKSPPGVGGLSAPAADWVPLYYCDSCYKLHMEMLVDSAGGPD